MNDYERAISESLSRKGWTVLWKGWPDILCANWSAEEIQQGVRTLARKPLKLFCVEIKRGSDRVSSEQAQMHTILNAAGIPCRVAREKDVEGLVRRKGTVFTAPETRSEMAARLSKLQRDLEQKLLECNQLQAQIEASTVLFDGADPEFKFSEPESEELEALEVSSEVLSGAPPPLQPEPARCAGGLRALGTRPEFVDPAIDPILRPREAADYLAVGQATLYRLIDAGLLPAPAKVGIRAVGWRRSVLDRYVTSRERQRA